MIIFSLLGSLCQTFPISPASTGMMAHSKKDAASPQLPPVTFLEGISQAGKELSEL
jgi:hypothetical protein